MRKKEWGIALLSAMALSACAGGENGSPAEKLAPAIPRAAMLPQTGNPANTELKSYTSWLSKSKDREAALAADKVLADNIVSWQMPHGGFYKSKAWYAAKWNGSAARSQWYGDGKVELGTIDNGATVSEILVLADVYGRTGNVAYRDSARKALEFLLNMQYPSGGFPQVYPARSGTSYSNHVTFNDNAMMRVLLLLDHAAQEKAPLTKDIFTAQQRARLQAAIDLALDYILKAQIVQDGVKTVWCAQHDALSYKPATGRSYELPSKSGQESVLIVAFLMSRPQTAAVAEAAKAGVAWYRRSAVQLTDTVFDPLTSRAANTSPFVAKTGSTTWYRFYDLATDTGFFSGRLPTDNPPGVGKQYDIMKVGSESRYTYQWGGSYGTRLFEYADSVGY